MKHSITEQGDVTLVALFGDIDMASGRELQKVFDRLLQTRKNQIVLDLSEVELIDSTGLSVIVGFFKRIRVGEGDIKLTALNATVRKLFKITHLDQVFEIFENPNDGVMAFHAAA